MLGCSLCNQFTQFCRSITLFPFCNEEHRVLKQTNLFWNNEKHATLKTAVFCSSCFIKSVVLTRVTANENLVSRFCKQAHAGILTTETTHEEQIFKFTAFLSYEAQKLRLKLICGYKRAFSLFFNLFCLYSVVILAFYAVQLT